MRRVIAFDDLAGRSFSHLVFPIPRRRVTGTFAKIRTSVSSEELLKELRGRMIDAAGETWRLEVYSIVDDTSCRWLQLGLAGREERTVLLKLPLLASADDALESIERWASDSSCRHGVVTVPPAV